MNYRELHFDIGTERERLRIRRFYSLHRIKESLRWKCLTPLAPLDDCATIKFTLHRFHSNHRKKTKRSILEILLAGTVFRGKYVKNKTPVKYMSRNHRCDNISVWSSDLVDSDCTSLASGEMASVKLRNDTRTKIVRVENTINISNERYLTLSL